MFVDYDGDAWWEKYVPFFDPALKPKKNTNQNPWQIQLDSDIETPWGIIESTSEKDSEWETLWEKAERFKLHVGSSSGLTFGAPSYEDPELSASSSQQMILVELLEMENRLDAYEVMGEKDLCELVRADIKELQKLYDSLKNSTTDKKQPNRSSISDSITDLMYSSKERWEQYYNSPSSIFSKATKTTHGIKEKIPDTLRADVLHRDKFTCQHCGRKAPDVVLHIDHVIPESKGGPATLENLQVLCEACNMGKGNRYNN